MLLVRTTSTNELMKTKISQHRAEQTKASTENFLKQRQNVALTECGQK